MKRCPGCANLKDDSEFYSDNTHVDGLSSRCKPCTLIKRAKYREANRLRLKETAKADRRRFPERGCWHVMIARCYKPSHEFYSQYGGRGIRVCDRWRDSFESFLADMGPRPSLQHSIDRIDVNGDYEPTNCRWSTQTEQMRNTRSNRMLTAFGKTQCVAAWAEETGLPAGTILDRLRFNWTVEDTLSHPRMVRGQRRTV
jgi:hypothetical protein